MKVRRGKLIVDLSKVDLRDETQCVIREGEDLAYVRIPDDQFAQMNGQKDIFKDFHPNRTTYKHSANTHTTIRRSAGSEDTKFIICEIPNITLSSPDVNKDDRTGKDKYRNCYRADIGGELGACGSLLRTSENGRLLGIHFAGSSYETYFCPVDQASLADAYIAFGLTSRLVSKYTDDLPADTATVPEDLDAIYHQSGPMSEPLEVTEYKDIVVFLPRRATCDTPPSSPGRPISEEQERQNSDHSTMRAENSEMSSTYVSLRHATTIPVPQEPSSTLLSAISYALPLPAVYMALPTSMLRSMESQLGLLHSTLPLPEAVTFARENGIQLNDQTICDVMKLADLSQNHYLCDHLISIEEELAFRSTSKTPSKTKDFLLKSVPLEKVVSFQSSSFPTLPTSASTQYLFWVISSLLASTLESCRELTLIPSILIGWFLTSLSLLMFPSLTATILVSTMPSLTPWVMPFLSTSLITFPPNIMRRFLKLVGLSKSTETFLTATLTLAPLATALVSPSPYFTTALLISFLCTRPLTNTYFQRVYHPLKQNKRTAWILYLTTCATPILVMTIYSQSILTFLSPLLRSSLSSLLGTSFIPLLPRPL